MIFRQSILTILLHTSLFLGYGMSGSEIQHRYLSCGDPSIQCEFGVIRVFEVKNSKTEEKSDEAPTACSDTEAFNAMSERCDGKDKCDKAAGGQACDLCNPAYLNQRYLVVTFGCLESKRVVTCDGDDVVHLGCGEGVVFVQKAFYGRMESNTCSRGRPLDQLTNTQCSQEGTLALWSQRCDGKRTCEGNMRENLVSDPCFGIFKYLDLSYICVPARISITCSGCTSSIDCGKGVIKVFHANFGRRDAKTCSAGRTEFSNQNCLQPNTLDVVKKWCEGKSSCTVGHDPIFGDPCYGTYKYLEVSYTCLGEY
ncbi:hypothetical protein UPYG_G00243050 [Umbra pygmaea]|uniref:SUEL-type lectin domain-containing protein n=1 Tax=Umbra pygmaea TaxID=75934 RepID=A0ABD0WY01_UMBPY